MGAASADQRPPIGPLPAGAKLGRYEILAKLAAGGMAIVYVARVHGVAGFERLVALKVLHSNLAHEEEFIKMFLDEARLAASIRHPNVVPTIDIDEGNAGFFIVMEYIEGDHLGQLLSNANKASEKLPIPAVLRVICDALGGLGAAHALCDEHGKPQNLVHRDVSPHNIMVGRDGVARLTDFGVAKAEDRLTHTRDGQVKGKLAYMAPEQAASGTTDPRSDLFSMGVILWECITGHRLMRAESTAATLHKLLHGEIPKPSSMDPHLAPLDPVLGRALSRDPEQRFQSAEEFARALEDAAAAYGGNASLREVGKIVKHFAAVKLKRDKKLIEDALNTLRPAGAGEADASGLLDETSSPTSPSSSEISIMANASPSLISKVSAVMANETIPGTRRASRRTGEVAVGGDKKLVPPPPPPLGAANGIALLTGDKPEALLGDIDPSPISAPDLKPIVIGGSFESLAPPRRVPWGFVMFGAAALALVGVWAASSPQEVVRVEEMAAPLDEPAAAATAREEDTPRAVVPVATVPARTDPADAPTSVSAPQPSVPVVVDTASGEIDADNGRAPAAHSVRPQATLRTRETPSKAPKPAVRRPRESTVGSNVSRSVAVRPSDVIPNPYHN